MAAIPDRHISFEVFSDDIPEMVAQGRVIASWGKNVYVKLPVTTTRREPLFEAVRTLSLDGVKINLTAIFTADQVGKAMQALRGGAPSCVSVFAGRLADFGIDYAPLMRDSIAQARELLPAWRERVRVTMPVVGLEAEDFATLVVDGPGDDPGEDGGPGRHEVRLRWRTSTAGDVRELILPVTVPFEVAQAR